MPIARSVFRGRHTGSPVYQSYSTTFPANESPMVEDGGWRLGQSTGLVWQNVKTVGGMCCASGFIAGSDYDDPIAFRTGIHPTRHYAQGTIFIAGGYGPVNGHECELHVGGNIAANSIRTYEVLNTPFSAFQLVRWNGALNDVEDIGGTNVNGGPITPTSGMVIRVEYSIVGGDPLIQYYQDGVMRLTKSDTDAAKKITSGQPGLAFFVRTGTGADLEGMGWLDFSCGTF